ncbi:uncharacterized protein LOC111280086 [Durio zibethinus]|uniref:Uncharacterized protein LOC111280086 n=1 Tax=Durio zibethinus TaxID=66656 RepID=A0A6P5X571_DURZI|nr:uncharacterized protein LOC111280086 [Durio zibethinus]
MAHSLTPVPGSATTHIAKSKKIRSHIPTLGLHSVWASCQKPNQVLDDKLVHRRTVTLSLAGAVLGLNVGDPRNAHAARKPPPPPPAEKKDPNVSGVQAKVLASKKRKEAMKQEISKMREKGKPIDGQSPSE